MLNIAIVGCGKIADDHAEQIQRIEGCRIVGVCVSRLWRASFNNAFPSNDTSMI